MRAFITWSGVVLVLVGSTACTLPGAAGSAPVVTETREVSGFNAVQLSSDGTLIVTQGPAETLTIEAADHFLPRITSTVQGGRLTLGPRDGWDWSNAFRPSTPITYHLMVKNLNAVGLSGAGNLRASDIRTDRLTIEISGAGSATIEGLTADELSVTISGAGSVTGSGAIARQTIGISGAGDFEGAKLAGNQATVTVSGAGSATVRASEALDVQISGAGNVTYFGTPKVVNQRVTGAGRLNQGRE